MGSQGAKASGETGFSGNIFIPSYVFLFGATAISSPYLAILVRDLGYSPIWVGIILSLYAGAGIVGPFVFGYWADKVGNYRHALIVSSVLPALVAVPLVLWVHPFFSSVFMALMAFGIKSNPALLDSVTTIQIGQTGNYGKIRVWGSVSFVVGVLFMQITPFLRPNTAGNIAVWIIVFCVLSALPYFILPAAALSSSTGPKPLKTTDNTEKGVPLFSAYVIGGMGIIFANSFSMSAVNNYFPLYLTEVLEWDVVGLMFAVGTTSEIPVIFLSAVLIRRFGSLPLLAIGTAAVALRLAVWAFLPFPPFVFASQLLHSLCYGMFFPAMVYFIAGIFPPKNRGKGMSVFVALGTGLPSLLGTLLGGAVLENVKGYAGFRLLFVIYAAIAAFGVLIYAAMRFGRAWEERRK